MALWIHRQVQQQQAVGFGLPAVPVSAVSYRSAPPTCPKRDTTRHDPEIARPIDNNRVWHSERWRDARSHSLTHTQERKEKKTPFHIYSKNSKAKYRWGIHKFSVLSCHLVGHMVGGMNCRPNKLYNSRTPPHGTARHGTQFCLSLHLIPISVEVESRDLYPTFPPTLSLSLSDLLWPHIEISQRKKLYSL